jgi:hypothetical protein
VNLAIHPRLVPRLRISGATPLLPHLPSWGAHSHLCLYMILHLRAPFRQQNTYGAGWRTAPSGGRNINLRCSKQVRSDGAVEIWTSSVFWWSDSHLCVPRQVVSNDPVPHPLVCCVLGKDEASETVATPSHYSSPIPTTTLISPPAPLPTITGTRLCSVGVRLSQHKQRALARGLYTFESLSPSSCVFFFASSSLHTLFRFVFLPRKCDNGSHVCVP